MMLECQHVGEKYARNSCQFCDMRHPFYNRCGYSGGGAKQTEFCYSWRRNVHERKRLNISGPPEHFGNYDGLWPTHASPGLD